jgi:phosphosulfolactate synthase (CoM biosynthesis protein A)
VDRYLGTCRELGFDLIEVSSGFITAPVDDLVRLVEKVQKLGLQAKPEVGIQFGAGGATTPSELAAEGTRDPQWAIALARRYLEAGVHLIMIESEGITECVTSWRTEVPGQFISALGLERVMFEAADPEVFAWYIKNYELVGARGDVQGMSGSASIRAGCRSDRWASGCGEGVRWPHGQGTP